MRRNHRRPEPVAPKKVRPGPRTHTQAAGEPVRRSLPKSPTCPKCGTTVSALGVHCAQCQQVIDSKAPTPMYRVNLG